MVFVLVYVLLGDLGYRVSYTPTGVLAAWWAPSGLALAAFLRTHRTTWPWIIVSVLVAATVVDLQQAISPVQVVYRTVADCVEPLVAASLLRSRYARIRTFSTVREVLGFSVIGGLMGPFAGTCIAAAGRLLTMHEPLGRVGAFAVVWFGSASLGVMLFAPALLTLRIRRARITPLRYGEIALLGAATVLLSLLARMTGTSGGIALVLGFAAFPALTWAAVRFGVSGAARTSAALSLLSVWAMLAAGTQAGPWRLVAIQSTYALAAFTALTLAALTSETRRLRAQAEAQALRAEETLALLDGAIRSAPFAFAFFDRGLRLTRFNDVFASLAKGPGAVVIGGPIEAVSAGAGRQLEPLLRSALTAGEPMVSQDIELTEGARRHWLCSAFPVRVSGREPAGVGLLMVDISERIAAERERVVLYQQAEEAIRARDSLLSIASHELKTPLTPLAARLYMIRKKIVEGQPVSPEAIDKTLKSVRQLTDLINDLLDASRIAHGGLTIRGEPLLLNDLVRASVDAYRDASPAHFLELEVPDVPIWVKGDAQRLTQVFTNLLDNAIKYSPDGGTVRVRVKILGKEAEITVTDEGIGIPEAYRRRLFERFFRAPNATLSYGGLGLGLYITRDIIDRHGGRIWAGSGPGRGTTFHVILPLLAPAEMVEALH
ncbi:MAG: MASE1 domain-containing protein [Myxococcaceae bacterium]|nr:MASE1 domain-containing protein [Myxococcaceae bacterium]